MKRPVAARKPAIKYPRDSPSPQQLFDIAAADKDYSNEGCLRSLASRTIFLTGRALGDDDTSALGRLMENRAAAPPQGLFGRFTSRLKRLWRLGNADQPIPAVPPTQSSDDTRASVVASVSFVEPGFWHGKKAHFIRLHIEYHPDATHHLETADSFAPCSHLDLQSLRPPAAPELETNAPPIVLYGPRAVVGRAAGSSAEPYWDGHFAAGDHFVYTAEATPPLDLNSAGPHASKLPRSLLDINTSGDPEEMRPAPSFEVAFVVLSDGEPFDMTAYSTSVHWGLPAVRRYLFDPYRPAKFGPATRLRPEGVSPIAIDFSSGEMKGKLMSHVDWARPYDTIWLGGPNGCTEKSAIAGRKCFSECCTMCRPRSNRHIA